MPEKEIRPSPGEVWKRKIAKMFCKLGLHKRELRHPFTHYGWMYGKLGLRCSRLGCGWGKTLKS